MKTIKVIRKIIAIVLISIILEINTLEVLAYTDINFRSLTNEDGLSQATVETMIQDKQGYVWVGTNDGLNRYNGYDFKVYRHEEEVKNSIANNYIVDIQEDGEGNIWVGTANGLSKINSENDSIKNYNVGEENGNLSHYNIGDILVTKSGDIYIGTSDGLNVYNKKEDRFENILKKPGDLSNQMIYCLAEDANGNIWVGTKNGLNKINIKENKIEYLHSGDDKNTISENSIYTLYYDKKGYIWAGTLKEGVNRIDIKTNEVVRYKYDNDNVKSISGNTVRDIHRDRYDNLWIATNNGICKLNEETGEFTTYNHKIYDKNSLVEDDTFSIMEDSGGLIWIGTYAGISIFDPNNKMKHYKNDPFDDNSINDNIIHGIHEDGEGLLWVGTNTKGVNIIDRKNNIVKHLVKSEDGNSISDDSVNDITGNETEIYIATNNGLNKIDKKTKKITIYNESDGLNDNNVRSLFLDSKGYLWIGSPDGINILNTANDEIIDIKKVLTNNGIEDTYIKSIYEDSEGIYWIGCFIEDGLVKIDPHKNTITNYKNEENNSKSISNNNIRSITEDIYGNIWVGTSYGLNKLDKKTGNFTRYTTKDGLPNNTIYGVLVDSENNPWVSTNLGISKLDIKTDSFENFSITDGLQGNEFNGCAYYKSKSGEFFFGGINGLNIFKPEELKKSNYTPEVKFGEFEVKGKKYKNIDKLKFRHDENFINIEVFFPDYKNSKGVQYLYKLEGANNDWSVLDANKINYSNLTPGKYTFKIKARNHNGILSDENSVSFVIKPPFWASGTAFLIYILIIISIVYYNINRVKRLDKMVKNRTKQLRDEMDKNNRLLNKVIELERSKNNYFINLSHELRTPLNVIHSIEQLITELNKSQNGIERDKLSEYMQVVRRNTKRLLNLINNLIDTTKIESNRYKINREYNDIVYVVEEATLSLKNYIENKGIKLIIDPEIEEKMISCDPYEIERCIVNIVGNAAKFTPEGGTIEVIIKDLDDKVKIIIKDTGIGIDKKYHKLIFDRFNQIIDANSEVKGGSGLGLTITKQIIDLHGGEIYVDSELNKGTTFTIII